jgi:hypothetical protein
VMGFAVQWQPVPFSPCADGLWWPARLWAQAGYLQLDGSGATLPGIQEDQAMSGRREQNRGPRSNYPAVGAVVVGVAAGIALAAAVGDAAWMVAGLVAGAAAAVFLSRRERR